MALENLDINKIRKQFTEICEAEKGELDKQRKIAVDLRRNLVDLSLKEWNGERVSFVAADGGDSRIRLDSFSAETPAVVELVRIADSDGKKIITAPVAGAADRVNFDEINNLDAVKELSKDLGCGKISEWSPYKKRSRSEQMRTYREIVEWAVFYKQLKICESDTLVVRDGALRTKVLKPDIFSAMNDEIQKVIRNKSNNCNVYCVGVAKQTVLLNRLHLAMSMENVFGDRAQYIPVPYEIAEKFYDHRWLDTMDTRRYGGYNSLANMYLVKFGEHPLDPVWSVDIPTWQEEEADKILSYLAWDARPGFPIPDFPMCIQKAHEHAKIGGIEMAYLQELLLDEIQKNMSNVDSEKILRARYLTEDVSTRRYSK